MAHTWSVSHMHSGTRGQHGWIHHTGFAKACRTEVLPQPEAPTTNRAHGLSRFGAALDPAHLTATAAWSNSSSWNGRRLSAQKSRPPRAASRVVSPLIGFDKDKEGFLLLGCINPLVPQCSQHILKLNDREQFEVCVGYSVGTRRTRPTPKATKRLFKTDPD